MKKPVTKLVGLSIHELSLVDKPANALSRGLVVKSADNESVELVKYLSTDEGAKTFDAFMADEEKQKRKNKVHESLWPPIDALRNSIASIKLDESLNDEQKSNRITEAVSQFDAIVNTDTSQYLAKHASNSDALLKMLTEHEESMSEDVTKKAEALEAQVAELTKSLAAAEILAKLTDDEKEYLSGLKDDEAEKFKKASADERKSLMNKSAEADEVFKSAEGHEIRKSVVGDGVFAILKAQAESIKATRDELAKTAERAQTVELTKRAEEEFANLPGETVAKVAVLKMVAGADEATRETLTAMLKAGNEALAKGYQTFGVSGGKPQDITKAAKRDELVKAHMAANPNVTKAAAEVAVISAHPDLYEG